MRTSPSVAAFVSLCGLAATVTGQPATPNWFSLTTSGDPAQRYGHEVCYFETRDGVGSILLHGGTVGATDTNETFLLNSRSGVWTNVSTTPAPNIRWSTAVAFDRGRNRVVLFGGQRSTTYFNDTWEFDGTSWIQVVPAASPSQRRFHAISYDNQRGVTVLFGGQNPSGTSLSDTWEWNGANWTQRSPATVPAPRSGHLMCFDLVRNVTVMVGGGSTTQTWEWNGTNWTQRANVPFISTSRGLTFDAARQRSILYLSEAQQGYEWDGVTWTALVASNTPPIAASTRSYIAYDENMGRSVFAHGGFAGTWLHGSPTPARLIGFGTGCPGTGGYLPRLRGQTAMELPWIGTNPSLDLSVLTSFPGGQITGLTLGTASVAVNLTPLGAPGCFAWGSGDIGTLAVQASGFGVAPYAITIPNNPSTVGQSFFIQGLVLDPINALGIVTSAGREIVVGN